MRVLLLTALMLLLLPAGLAAQYGYDQDYRYWDRGYYDRDINSVARRLSASAAELWQMVQNRPEYRRSDRIYIYNSVRDFARDARDYRANPSDWRARRLIDRAERISRYVDRTQLPYEFRDTWFNVENQVALVGRYHGISFDRDRRFARTDPSYRSGSFRWRGRVDGSDIVFLRGNQVDYRHISARPITSASSSLSAPLPRDVVNLQLRRIEGRGVIRLIQQPSPANNFTAGVLIEDDAAGSDFYEFELFW